MSDKPTELGDIGQTELDEILADACIVTREHQDREAADSCCQQCGDEYDEENPPHYDVSHCVYGTRDCTNDRHLPGAA